MTKIYPTNHELLIFMHIAITMAKKEVNQEVNKTTVNLVKQDISLPPHWCFRMGRDLSAFQEIIKTRELHFQI